jgi:hypothetical protein
MIYARVINNYGMEVVKPQMFVNEEQAVQYFTNYIIYQKMDKIELFIDVYYQHHISLLYMPQTNIVRQLTENDRFTP